MAKKYIDATLLREEIDRIEEEARKVRVSGTDKEAMGADGKVRFCLELKSFIGTLQQEQQEGLHFTPLNRLVQKIPSENWNDSVNNYAKKLRDCLIKEGYRKDAEVLQGYISYMNGNNVPMATMDEHEQPQVADASKMEQEEVDLEKEIKDWCDKEVTGVNPIYTGDSLTYSMLPRTARHFYELGLNARKEK